MPLTPQRNCWRFWGARVSAGGAARRAAHAAAREAAHANAHAATWPRTCKRTVAVLAIHLPIPSAEAVAHANAHAAQPCRTRRCTCRPRGCTVGALRTPCSSLGFAGSLWLLILLFFFERALGGSHHRRPAFVVHHSIPQNSPRLRRPSSALQGVDAAGAPRGSMLVMWRG